MTDLSPAAQAVAWAYDNAPERPTGNHRYHWIAAALRAVAGELASCLFIGPDEGDIKSLIDVSDLHDLIAELEAQ